MVDTVAAMLLRSAEVDVAACRVLDAAPGMSDTVIGFHAQQACEKCLKAVLSSAGIETSRTHDLTRLLDLLTSHGIAVPSDSQGVEELNPYAVEARYGLVEAGGLDRHRALTLAQTLLDWATRFLAGTGS